MDVVDCLGDSFEWLALMAKSKRVYRRRKKLNLTVSPAARRQAEELAARQHRSLSNLFEYLIDLELQREQKRTAAEQERA